MTLLLFGIATPLARNDPFSSLQGTSASSVIARSTSPPLSLRGASAPLCHCEEHSDEAISNKCVANHMNEYRGIDTPLKGDYIVKNYNPQKDS